MIIDTVHAYNDVKVTQCKGVAIALIRKLIGKNYQLTVQFSVN